MPSLRIPCPIRPKILPEYCVTLDRLECDTHIPLLPLPYPIPLLTLQEPAPPLPVRHPQPWKIRPPTLTVRIEIHHKRAKTIPTPRQRPGPVIVVAVVAGGIVALRPHALDVQVRTPALEGAGAVFQTADCVVAVEKGTVGEAFGWVYPFSLAVVDDGRGVFVHAGIRGRFVRLAWSVVILCMWVCGCYGIYPCLGGYG